MLVEIKENIPIAPYTVYKIGGPAIFFVEIKNSEELKEALNFAVDKNLPFFILGAGSNVLISDQGFNGLVIKISGGNIKVDGESLMIDSGVMMARAVAESAKAGLTGFEWGIGVPGTVGGSVRGNAGCFGNEMSQILEHTQVFEVKSEKLKVKNLGKNSAGRIFGLSNKECKFNYRDSVFKKHPEWVILSATLKLQKGDPKEIQEKIKKFTADRSEKQDIGTKSCGCIFKNIKWSDTNKAEILEKFSFLEQFKDRPTIPASFLIDQIGLKNLRKGKIFISPKHANFFVNEGGGTAAEVKILIETVKEKIKNHFGLTLEEEIQYLGDHDPH
ncbi:MAG: UDP-N-acetylmuramate dehydrogenase [bacterium]|nr:UDP-N-acetylmuramate dehydrogenase [bacterium]